MATIKSYTDLQQSKKLSEILPLETADMRYEYPSREKDEIQEPMIGFHTSSFNWFKESDSFIYFPCWSLAALLGVIPNYKLSSEHNYHTCTAETSFGKETVTWFDNPVDACYEMIIRLNELNLL